MFAQFSRRKINQTYSVSVDFSMHNWENYISLKIIPFPDAPVCLRVCVRVCVVLE